MYLVGLLFQILNNLTMSLIVRTFARNLAGRPAVKIPESAPVVVPPPEITQE